MRRTFSRRKIGEQEFWDAGRGVSQRRRSTKVFEIMQEGGKGAELMGVVQVRHREERSDVAIYWPIWRDFFEYKNFK